ncbi:hypothetical protein ACTQV6_01150 [Holdemanella porci]
MSKKKKNIRRKKSNNLLKGMAAAGAVVGGGTIFAGNNAVYAAENEQGVVGSQSEEQIIESQSVSESTTESLSQAKSETSNFESEASAATYAVEGNTVQTNLENGFVKRSPRFFNNEQAQSSDEQNIMLADETGNEKAVNENSAEQEAASLSVSGSVSGSISEVGSQISSESISGSEAESKMVSESSSISASTEEFKSDSASLSTSTSLSSSTETSTYTSESESLSKEFASTSVAFDSHKNQTLEDLITNINNTKRELEEIRQTAIKNNNTTLGEAYRLKADDLAKYLAQYNFYQKYGDGRITNTNTKFNNNGIGGSYDRNNTYLEYTTQGPQGSVIHTGYFDWIAVTEKKDSHGNLILDKDGKVQYKRVEYNQVPASEVVQIVVLKKAPIYSNSSHVDSYGDKESFYYYEDESGEKHFFLTEIETKNVGTWWDPVYKTKYEYKALDSTKVQIKLENGDEIEFEYKGKTYKFSVLKESNGDHYYPYFGEVPDKLDSDEDGRTNDTTTKGTPYFSIKDYENQQTKYDKQRSEFTSVSEKQSRHKSDSIKNSESKSESLSLSNSKSNSMTSDSLSKSTSLSAKKSDIESRSISHSLLESTEIATSQSTSTSVSESQSTSTSVSESQSTSTSVSSSQSTSTSVSESQSTSTSVSESQSTSTSVSESQSTSASASLSGSASVSALESESLSNSVFESLSNSLSSSESTSLSSSESVSASDSFATSVTTTTTGGDTTYRRVVVDTRAPLQVAPRETEEVVEDETPKANPEETETIEKEKMPKSTLDVTHRVWWSWIPIVGALVSMNETRKRRKEENDADKEKEEESKDKKLK